MISGVGESCGEKSRLRMQASAKKRDWRASIFTQQSSRKGMSIVVKREVGHGKRIRWAE